jgi:hypothetical protein
MAELQYCLGCPMWSNQQWVGELFTSNAKPADFLRQYSSVFNTVEGNTTFYALVSQPPRAAGGKIGPALFAIAALLWFRRTAGAGKFSQVIAW